MGVLGFARYAHALRLERSSNAKGGLGEAQMHGFVERSRDEPIRFDEVESL
jgi:hypothetical protein